MSSFKGSNKDTSSRVPSENLAIVFQEILTTIVRMRSGRQAVSDATVFRQKMIQAIKMADQEARQRGYATESSHFAILAIVAFLDETILNLHSSAFSEWAKNTLQGELFGINNLGLIFFKNVDQLLNQLDSAEAGDVLEIYQLCLLLGYKGQYGMSEQADLRSRTDSISRKMRQIRGDSRDRTPLWAIPRNETIASKPDPWMRRFAWTAAMSGALAILLFTAFTMFLHSGTSEVQTITSEKMR